MINKANVVALRDIRTEVDLDRKLSPDPLLCGCAVDNERAQTDPYSADKIVDAIESAMGSASRNLAIIAASDELYRKILEDPEIRKYITMVFDDIQAESPDPSNSVVDQRGLEEALRGMTLPKVDFLTNKIIHETDKKTVELIEAANALQKTSREMCEKYELGNMWIMEALRCSYLLSFEIADGSVENFKNYLHLLYSDDPENTVWSKFYEDITKAINAAAPNDI